MIRGRAAHTVIIDDPLAPVADLELNTEEVTRAFDDYMRKRFPNGIPMTTMTMTTKNAAITHARLIVNAYITLDELRAQQRSVAEQIQRTEDEKKLFERALVSACLSSTGLGKPQYFTVGGVVVMVTGERDGKVELIDAVDASQDPVESIPVADVPLMPEPVPTAEALSRFTDAANDDDDIPF